MTTISKRIMLVALAILTASLLAACADTASNSSQPSALPAANQAMPTATAVPTATPLPTPTPRPTIESFLLPTATVAGLLVQKGEPADLANTQLELQGTVNAYLTAAATPKAAALLSLPTAATNPNPAVQPTTGTNPVSQPTIEANPPAATTIPAVASKPGQPVTATCSSDTSSDYYIPNWSVSAKDITLDIYQSHIIVGLIVCNRGQSNAAFSNLNLTLHIDSNTVSLAPDSLAQAYISYSHLEAAQVGTFGTTMASNTAKILYGAFPGLLSKSETLYLETTNPFGWMVLLQKPHQ